MTHFLLIIDGPTGAGKSTAADIIHKEIPRTALLGMDRIKWSVSGFRRDRRNNEMINKVVLAMAREFLVGRVNVIVEQGFHEGGVEIYQQLGKELSVKTITVQLLAPRDVLLTRIDQRSKIPHPNSVPPVPRSRVLNNIRKHANKTPVSSIKIDTIQYSPSEIAAKILNLI